MTIVNTRYRPKRPAKKAMPATIKGSRIVSARKPGKGARTLREPVDDPEADARVKAFFSRVIWPRSEP
jgi:hypothetical protein